MRRRAGNMAVLTTTAMLLPACVFAADPPKLKEGLWEIHGQSTENPGAKRLEFAYKLCRDHAFDKATNAMLKNVKGCNTEIKKLDGGKFASASTCTVAGITIVSTGLSEFKSDTATHFETHATYTPPFNGKTDESMTQDQQYLGKCAPGMKPGDRLLPDGIIQHHN